MYYLCIQYKVYIKQSGIFFQIFKIYMHVRIYTQKHMYIYIYTHMYTIWKNTLKYKKNIYLWTERTIYLKYIHWWFWQRKQSRYYGHWSWRMVKAYRGGNNISEVKCRDPTDWPFHLEVARMIPFIEPSLAGFA